MKSLIESIIVMGYTYTLKEYFSTKDSSSVCGIIKNNIHRWSMREQRYYGLRFKLWLTRLEKIKI